MIEIHVTRGASSDKRFRFLGDQVLIGRADSNHLVFDEEHLSASHGLLTQKNDRWTYRDQRSTNGSVVRRGDQRIALGPSNHWSIEIKSGDVLELGAHVHPVVLRVTMDGDHLETLPDSEPPTSEHTIATSSVSELPRIRDRAFEDPTRAQRIYQALVAINSQTDYLAAAEAVVIAAFALLPKATHVALLARRDQGHATFKLTLAMRKCEQGTLMESSASDVRASRAILKKVLDCQSGFITANAREELGNSESIMSGQIMSTIAVPLFRGHDITGVLQIDNRDASGVFTKAELEASLLVANHAALALENAHLLKRLSQAEVRLRDENRYLKSKQSPSRARSFIGQSRAVQGILAEIDKVADTDATVCFLGETGTGKEILATQLHHRSNRSEQLLVAQNCAALPENLLESELFGHVKGAFTSADADKKGLFEIADEGTLFLDEIGEMPPSLQSKVLRVLQQGTFRSVGATEERQVNVRIVCATHRNLELEVKAGRFREDLFYRLMVFPIDVPALRERSDDIPLLVHYFFDHYQKSFRRQLAGISDAAMAALCSFRWPGNVRQLENEIQRIIIQVDEGQEVQPGDLSPRIANLASVSTPSTAVPSNATLKERMDAIERALLEESLSQHEGNKTRTAKTLGMTREGLHKKLARHKL